MVINNLYNNFIFFHFIVIFNYLIFIFKLKYDSKCKNIYFFRKRICEILRARRYFATGRFLNLNKKFFALVLCFRKHVWIKRSPEVIFIEILFRVNYFLLLIVIRKFNIVNFYNISKINFFFILYFNIFAC